MSPEERNPRDDTAAIQEAIDTVESFGGGVVFFPAGLYRITAPLLMKSNVTLLGAGARVRFAADGTSWYLRGFQLGLTGTVIDQVTPGADGIIVQNQDGSGAPLFGVGIFDLAIAFGASPGGSPQSAGIATGHGINVKPPTAGVNLRNSVIGMRTDGVVTYGHDGDHYGLRLEGVNTCTFGSLLSYGGGGLLIKAPDINSVFRGMIQVLWQNPGTAHGVHLDGTGVAGMGVTYIDSIQTNSDFGLGGVSATYAFKWNNLLAGFAIGQFDTENFSGAPAGLVSGDGSELTVLGGNSAPGPTLVGGGAAGITKAYVAQLGGGSPAAGAIIIRGDVGTGVMGGATNIWYLDYQGLVHVVNQTDASGTPGNVVMNKPAGKVAIPVGASSVVVTNNLVTADSIVTAVLQAQDATLTQILRVVPGAGTFTIVGNANATAAVKVAFKVQN